ncbi:MAG TPA: vitamin B12-dependent ribonucleotide reductase, partial [Tetragenococcus sp.]|nr:vitamin B12-dependent ribonucleotide reductase [Tetragenococcus sp.]
VEQGGSRRGAQMIMLADWHPDVIEFIISKMQNARILRYLLENTEDAQIKTAINEKLKFTLLTAEEKESYEFIASYKNEDNKLSPAIIEDAQQKLRDGGTYGVNDPEFLSGANISITLTDDFMQAVKKDDSWQLRFPDLFHYNAQQMDAYNTDWQECGDVRQWAEKGYPVATYRTIKARELWKLINICATYSAEPGIFFIDNANRKTNAVAYGQKVVATNPCGEQPLAPYSVCNLGAINLANMADKKNATVDFEKLKETVKIAVQMQDDVIDSTPYFMAENKKQALGERRIGLGVMGLADLLIYTHQRYGSKTGNQLVDKIFATIAITAYKESIRLAKLKGSFPFLVGKNEQETQQLRQRFVDSGYMKEMPAEIRQAVLKNGIRNSHLLTVAPTGSTGTMVGVATGLEPYFAFKYYRSGRLGKFIEVDAQIVQEFLADHPETKADQLPDFFVSAMELKPEEHVDVQTTIQRWVDSSISKTVNAPKGYTVQQVASIYERLYDGNAKGGTVYVDGSRDSQVLTLESEKTSDQQTRLFDTEDIRIVDDSDELEQLVEQAENEHIQQVGHTDDVIYGSEVGDTCPICRQGIVEDIGGCNTCTNCHAQLRCGL